ncbi:MAG: 2-oxoacid:ferredoxin oxidoreductase subunit beta [Planctomycetota bacterium]
MTDTIAPKPTAKDFKSDQDVRWCPGCGDYTILAMMQRVLPEFETRREKYAFVSGIGCSSRFPYYMNTYGFHTIHGRAPALATGVKLANPDLEVWVISGDGDSMSIGGNHLIHAIRRNVNMKLVIFNNRIYGLTKGQYSPTSEPGKVTPSSPMGSVDAPFNPASLILGAGASFFARTTDRDTKHMQEMFRRAQAHKGFAVIEIFQNCSVFNDGAFDSVTEKEVRDDARVELVHGEPMVFGKNKEKGILLKGLKPEVVSLEGRTKDDLLVHDEKNPYQAALVAKLGFGDGMPTPIGVFTAREEPVFDDAFLNQVAVAKQKKGPGKLEKLLDAPDAWEI